MANNLLNNPVYFDTVGTTSKISSPVIITAISWSGATATDTLEITDSEGKYTVYKASCPVTASTITIEFPKTLVCPNGIALKTLTHGLCLVYV
jgi:hypothetical protein